MNYKVLTETVGDITVVVTVPKNTPESIQLLIQGDMCGLMGDYLVAKDSYELLMVMRDMNIELNEKKVKFLSDLEKEL